MLYKLERTPKLLTLQDLKVRVISVGQPKDLLTTITVSGYLLGALAPDKIADKPGERPADRAGPGGAEPGADTGKAGPARPGAGRPPGKKG
jgi:hypothetical protein